MTIPRELVLQSAENGFFLSQKPIKELAEIRDEHIHFTNLIVKPNDNPIQQIKGKTWEILAEFEIGIVEEFGLKVCQFHGEETIIGYSVSKEELFVDRRKSGESSFQKSFASKERVHLKADKNRIKLHVFVDWSSVEVFANVGRISITDLIFPDDKSDGLEVFSIGGEVKLLSLDLYRLRAI